MATPRLQSIRGNDDFPSSFWGEVVGDGFVGWNGYARWARTSYKWSYNLYKWPYKWVTGVITLLIGVITPFKTDRGPPCGKRHFGKRGETLVEGLD